LLHRGHAPQCGTEVTHIDNRGIIDGCMIEKREQRSRCSLEDPNLNLKLRAVR
jgi:hypothetical protein